MPRRARVVGRGTDLLGHEGARRSFGAAGRAQLPHLSRSQPFRASEPVSSRSGPARHCASYGQFNSTSRRGERAIKPTAPSVHPGAAAATEDGAALGSVLGAAASAPFPTRDSSPMQRPYSRCFWLNLRWCWRSIALHITHMQKATASNARSAKSPCPANALEISASIWSTTMPGGVGVGIAKRPL
jgi:hypothetical protein